MLTEHSPCASFLKQLMGCVCATHPDQHARSLHVHLLLHAEAARLHKGQGASMFARPMPARPSGWAGAAGRWEVRIGLKGSKHVYLGLHTSEVDAAKVYDRALVLLTGQAAATNFPSMQYSAELAEYEECAPAPVA